MVSTQRGLLWAVAVAHPRTLYRREGRVCAGRDVEGVSAMRHLASARFVLCGLAAAVACAGAISPEDVSAAAGHARAAPAPLNPVVATSPESAATFAVNEPYGYLVALGGRCRTACVRVFATRTTALLHTVTLPGTILFNVQFNPQSVLVLDRDAGRAVVTTFVQRHGTTVGGFVTMVDTKRGLRRWTLASALPPPIDVAVAERAGRVLIVHGSVTVPWQPAQLRVVDARTGRVIGTSRLDALYAGLAVDERGGRAFVVSQPADRNGNPHGPAHLRVLGLASGHLVRTALVPQNASAPTVAPRSGRVFVLSYSDSTPHYGQVTTLDARSGRVLRTVASGSMPRALTVDETAGRVYCLNYGYPPAHTSLSVLDVQRPHRGSRALRCPERRSGGPCRGHRPGPRLRRYGAARSPGQRRRAGGGEYGGSPRRAPPAQRRRGGQPQCSGH